MSEQYPNLEQPHAHLHVATEATASVPSSFAAPYGSAVLCDMIGCREHATGEVQIGDEYIPLCEIHRKAEMDRLTPRWRPLPPHPPNSVVSANSVEVLTPETERKDKPNQ